MESAPDLEILFFFQNREMRATHPSAVKIWKHKNYLNFFLKFESTVEYFKTVDKQWLKISSSFTLQRRNTPVDHNLKRMSAVQTRLQRLKVIQSFLSFVAVNLVYGVKMTCQTAFHFLQMESLAQCQSLLLLQLSLLWPKST